MSCETSNGQRYARVVYTSDSFFKPNRVATLGQLTIELTERCNNRCQHCYINRPANDTLASKNEMKTGMIKNLIHQASDLGCLSVRFTGGEPLLRDDFDEIYTFTRKNGFFVSLSTNARLLTPERIELFKTLPPRRPINITVYGMQKESYERVSGVQGSFDEFRQGVQRLADNHIEFCLSMAMLPQNRQDIPAFENWHRALFNGEQEPVFITTLYQRARRDDPQKDRRIQSLRLPPQESVDILTRSKNYRNELTQYCRRFTGKTDDSCFICGFGESLSVDAYGFAMGCQLMRHPNFLYNLHNGTLEQAWKTFFPALAACKATDADFLRRCARCVLRGLCNQCPAQSWMEHGTMDTPVEYLCDIAHAHAEKLGLLAKGEKGWKISDWDHRIQKISEIDHPYPER